MRIRDIYRLRYQAFLKSEEWFAIANEIKSAAGWRCERCECGGKLEAHHYFYKGVWKGLKWKLIPPPELRRRVLVALCRDCHELYHEFQDSKDYHGMAVFYHEVEAVRRKRREEGGDGMAVAV